MEHLGNFDYFLGLCISDGHFTNFVTNFHEISIISSNEGGNRWTIEENSGFYGIFQIFPEDLPKPHYLRDKESLNSSTQAKLSLRSRFSSKHLSCGEGAAVQTCLVIT